MVFLSLRFIKIIIGCCFLDLISFTVGDLNNNHLNTKLFEVRISNGLEFKWLVYGQCPMH